MIERGADRRQDEEKLEFRFVSKPLSTPLIPSRTSVEHLPRAKTPFCSKLRATILMCITLLTNTIELYKGNNVYSIVSRRRRIVLRTVAAVVVL